MFECLLLLLSVIIFPFYEIIMTKFDIDKHHYNDCFCQKVLLFTNQAILDGYCIECMTADFCNQSSRYTSLHFTKECGLLHFSTPIIIPEMKLRALSAEIKYIQCPVGGL